MNRAQLRAKAERRRMRQGLIKGKSGWDARIGWREYNTWLFLKGWLWNDPKKVAKREPWREMVGRAFVYFDVHYKNLTIKAVPHKWSLSQGYTIPASVEAKCAEIYDHCFPRGIKEYIYQSWTK